MTEILAGLSSFYLRRLGSNRAALAFEIMMTAASPNSTTAIHLKSSPRGAR
jgi:hypothetical protein